MRANINKSKNQLINSVPFYYGWIIVIVAGLATFFTGPGQTYSFSLFINPLIDEFGWSRGQINNIYSFATLVSGSTMFLVGKIVDKQGVKKVMLISSILLGCAMFLLSSLTGNVAMLFIGFFFGRFSGQGTLGLTAGVLTPKWFLKKRGFAIMLASLFGSVSQSVYPKLNLWLINTYGWRVAWQVLGATVLIFFVPICIIFCINRPEDVGLYPDNVEPSEDNHEEMKAIQNDEQNSLTQGEALRTPAFWLLFFAAAQLSMIVTGINLNAISIYETSGLEAGFATTIMSISPLIGLATSLLMGSVIDKLKKPQVILSVSMFMQAAGYVALALMSSKAHAYVYMILLGVAGAAFALTHNVLKPYFFGRKYLGGVNGIMTIAWVGGSALGPTVFGSSYEILGGYTQIILALSVIPVLVGSAILFIKKPKKV